ncbi:MAG: PilW family protein, partial [Variovorax sp.]
RKNWQRVRSLRIGLVLRGPLNSAQDRNPDMSFYPLGKAMYSSSDPGTKLVPAQDGRLRQTVTFTVHLHNRQGS